MTGANRLLIGLGWAAVVLLACFRDRTRHLVIPSHQRLEMRFLLLSTLYSFLIPLERRRSACSTPPCCSASSSGTSPRRRRATARSRELVGPAAWIESRVGNRARRLIVAALLFYSAGAIFVSAEPFAEGLVHVGTNYDIDKFLLVQWVAPLASESPEFVIALLFAWRHRGALGLGALISSKVNQWTLLVGALPIAYAVARGALGRPAARRAADRGAAAHLGAVAARHAADLRPRLQPARGGAAGRRLRRAALLPRHRRCATRSRPLPRDLRAARCSTRRSGGSGFLALLRPTRR